MAAELLWLVATPDTAACCRQHKAPEGKGSANFDTVCRPCAMVKPWVYCRSCSWGCSCANPLDRSCGWVFLLTVLKQSRQVVQAVPSSCNVCPLNTVAFFVAVICKACGLGELYPCSKAAAAVACSPAPERGSTDICNCQECWTCPREVCCAWRQRQLCCLLRWLADHC